MSKATFTLGPDTDPIAALANDVQERLFFERLAYINVLNAAQHPLFKDVPNGTKQEIANRSGTTVVSRFHALFDAYLAIQAAQAEARQLREKEAMEAALREAADAAAEEQLWVDPAIRAAVIELAARKTG